MKATIFRLNLLLAFLVLFSLNLSAQDFKELFEIGNELLNEGKYEQALEYCLKAEKLIDDGLDVNDVDKGQTYALIGLSFISLGKNEEAYLYIKNGYSLLSTIEGFDRKLVNGLETWLSNNEEYSADTPMKNFKLFYKNGFKYYDNREYTQALNYLLKAEEIIETGLDIDLMDLGLTHVMTGFCYKNLNDNEKAYPFLKKGYEILYKLEGIDTELIKIIKSWLEKYEEKSSDESVKEFKELTTSAIKLFDQKEFKQALKTFLKSEKLIHDKLDINQGEIGQAFVYIGFCYIELDDNKKAKQYMNKGYSVLKNIASIDKNFIDELESYQIKLGSSSSEWDNLNSIALKYYNDGNYVLAVENAEKALNIAKNDFGTKHKNYIISLINLALYYKYQRKLFESEKLYLEALQLNRKVYSSKKYQKSHQNLVIVIYGLAQVYQDQNKFGKAETLYVEALHLNRGLYPTDKYPNGHNDLASSINHMAVFYNGRGRYPEAEPLLEEALQMRRRLFKGDHPDLAQSINNMAAFYNGRGQYSETEPLYIEALQMNRRLFKGDHPDLAQSINNMAAFYNGRGRYYEAEPILDEALQMRRRLFKGDHPDLAMSLSNRAAFYEGIGRYDEAEPILEEALQMRRRLFKGDHPDLAQSINNMAAFYNGRGRYYEAEPLLEETLHMGRRLFKGDHPNLALSVNNMAVFYKSMGRYSEAEPLYIEALEMRKRLFRVDHPDLAQSINSMAAFYKSMGRYSEAEPLYIEALEMRKRLFRVDHPDLAQSIYSMAAFYESMGRYPEAEPQFEEALQMRRRLFKGDHPDLASSINNMAAFYNGRGRYSEAEPLLNEALQMMRCLFNGDHPNLASSINNMAMHYDERERYDDAEPLFMEALDNDINFYSNNHSYLSESEKRKFWKTRKSKFKYFNSFTEKRFADNSSITITTFNNLLFTKGMLLSSSIRVKNNIINSGNDNLIKKYNDWISLKQIINKNYSFSKSELDQRGINLDSLQNLANDKEKELSLLSEDFAKEKKKIQYKFENVKRSLKLGEAAVEIVRYYYYDKRWTDTVHYAALIVKNDSEYPELVVLENGNMLEKELLGLQKKCDNETHLHSTPEYYNNYWKPIRDKLDGIKTVYISADGVYNQINLNTLINPETNKYVLEDGIDIHYVTSTREIIDRAERKYAKEAVLAGDPDYDLSSEKHEMLIANLDRSGTITQWDDKTYKSLIDRDSKLSPLPNTQFEIDEIDNVLTKERWTTQKYLNDSALESSIKRVKSPGILHLSTHGYFIATDEMVDKKREYFLQSSFLGFENKAFYQNPLLRSGLFFAGSQLTLDNKQIRSQNIDDGILTAQEVSLMDLTNTELVVLSACETGLGDVMNGEGVYGLQRAFKMAGTKGLIMSLWKVPDQATKDMMVMFYKNWIEKDMTKREALKQAQLEMIEIGKEEAKKGASGDRSKQYYSHPKYWGGFVYVGN